MTAEIRADVVVATEHINAPPEVVFCYFTDPALIIAWIGDDAELDPEPGGTFCLHMGRVTARGTYLIVEPPHRVVFTWGVPGSDDLPPGSSIVEVNLTAVGDTTTVVLTHRTLPPSQLDIHRKGWEHQLDGLAVAVARR